MTDRLLLPGGDARIEELISEPRVAVLHRSAQLCVLSCDDFESEAVWKGRGAPWIRIFERTYLAPLADDLLRRDVIGAFFNWLGLRYAAEIDQARNIACYEFLYEQACEVSGRETFPALLDVGCGPGTILESALARHVPEIVGYDIGNNMREIAQTAGLRVLSDQEFHAASREFPLALSAYAMHYGCDTAGTLAAVAGQLAVDGLWLMNFHKNINAENFLSNLPSNGLKVVRRSPNVNFGLVVAVAV